MPETTQNRRCAVLWCSAPEHQYDMDSAGRWVKAHEAYSATLRPVAASSGYQSVEVWTAVDEWVASDGTSRFDPPRTHVASPGSAALTPGEARRIGEMLHRAACTAEVVEALWTGGDR